MGSLSEPTQAPNILAHGVNGKADPSNPPSKPADQRGSPPSDGREQPFATWIQTPRHSNRCRNYQITLGLLPQSPAPSERTAAAIPQPTSCCTLALLGFARNPAASAMAKTKQGKRDVDAYTIKGTNKVVRGKPLPARALDRRRRVMLSKI